MHTESMYSVRVYGELECVAAAGPQEPLVASRRPIKTPNRRVNWLTEDEGTRGGVCGRCWKIDGRIPC